VVEDSRGEESMRRGGGLSVLNRKYYDKITYIKTYNQIVTKKIEIKIIIRTM
jgi:hypothetical protein